MSFLGAKALKLLKYAKLLNLKIDTTSFSVQLEIIACGGGVFLQELKQVFAVILSDVSLYQLVTDPQLTGNFRKSDINPDMETHKEERERLAL